MENQRIDPYAFVPKYYQLFTILRNKIEDGDLPPLQSIPSERELESFYKVSRTTIRQAISLLTNQGYVYREHGRGTFVAPPKLQNSLHELTSFSQDMQDRGLVPGQRILELAYIEPSQKVRQQLELASSTRQVLYLKRLRLANDKPIGIHAAYLPLDPSQPITAEEINQSGSLYSLLQNKFNLIPSKAYETIEATIADPEEAQLLEIKEGSPLLLFERTVWSQSRQAMEFVRVLYRADRYQYFVHLTK
jgi:GntR family transcriptional regulator